MTDYLAVAHHQVGEDAASIDLHLATSDRAAVVHAHAVQLLVDYALDPKMLAYIAAEACAQLVEVGEVNRRLTGAAILPPAADEIRLAADFPDNQPLGGRHG